MPPSSIDAPIHQIGMSSNQQNVSQSSTKSYVPAPQQQYPNNHLQPSEMQAYLFGIRVHMRSYYDIDLSPRMTLGQRAGEDQPHSETK